jgi:hypothetical protein
MPNGKGNGKGRRFQPELWVDYGPPKKGRNGRKGKPKKGPRSAPGPSRTYASNVLTQGCGTVPAKAWGGRDGMSLHAWDAKMPHHLPLPRAVGPYTTIRATKRVSLAASCFVIGTTQHSNTPSSANGNWDAIVMISSIDSGLNIDATNNAFRHAVDLGLESAATLVPSALTVQIMCPTALQTASGFLYAGVMNTQAAIGGRGEKWTTYFDRFVQFQAPRLLSAGKLVLRGIQCNSYPLNMSEVSKFTPLHNTTDGIFTWDVDQQEPIGWAPIMIYNPGQATLEFLITVEYRVRFDLTNPASASHTQHKVASDSMWGTLMSRASAMGHGVKDIADLIATTGTAISAARTAGSALAIA